MNEKQVPLGAEPAEKNRSSKLPNSASGGVLSRHLQILQESELVEVWKRFQLKRPQTLCRLTDVGRQRLIAYIDELERVVADAAAARQAVVNSSNVQARGAPFILPGLAPG